MEIIRRLEFICGILYVVAVAGSVYFIGIPQLKLTAERLSQPVEYNWLWTIIPPVLFLVSAYFHAFRRSYLALGYIILWGGLGIVLMFLSVVMGSAFGGYPLVGISPGIFAFATTALAIISTIDNLQHRQRS